MRRVPLAYGPFFTAMRKVETNMDLFTVNLSDLRRDDSLDDARTRRRGVRFWSSGCVLCLISLHFHFHFN